MIVNVNVVEKLSVKVTASSVSIDIGRRESLNFTADYVLHALHPNEAWHLPQPFGEPVRTISRGVLSVIRTAIRANQERETDGFRHRSYEEIKLVTPHGAGPEYSGRQDRPLRPAYR